SHTTPHTIHKGWLPRFERVRRGTTPPTRARAPGHFLRITSTLAAVFTVALLLIPESQAELVTTLLSGWLWVGFVMAVMSDGSDRMMRPLAQHLATTDRHIVGRLSGPVDRLERHHTISTHRHGGDVVREVVEQSDYPDTITLDDGTEVRLTESTRWAHLHTAEVDVSDSAEPAHIESSVARTGDAVSMEVAPRGAIDDRPRATLMLVGQPGQGPVFSLRRALSAFLLRRCAYLVAVLWALYSAFSVYL